MEPFEEEVLIEGATASLSSCNQLHKLEKPVCSLQIPNNLLLKWHKERAGESYTACLAPLSQLTTHKRGDLMR